MKEMGYFWSKKKKGKKIPPVLPVAVGLLGGGCFEQIKIIVEINKK